MQPVCNFDEKYFSKNNTQQLKFLRDLKLEVSNDELVKMPSVKKVVVSGQIDDQKDFVISKDGEYYNGKESLTKYLKKIKSLHDRNSATSKLKVSIESVY